MSTDHPNTIHLPARDVPVAGEYDVVVCGGGFAGVGAAIAAARRGARTLLIERAETLGGIGAGGGVGSFCYCHDPLVGLGKVFEDIWDGLVALGAAGEEHGWPYRRDNRLGRENWAFDHALLPEVLSRLAADSGVDAWIATDAVSVVTDGPRVLAVVVHNRSCLQAVLGKVFIDATGDGTFSRHAGADVLAVEEPGVIQPSLMVFLRVSDQPVPQPVPFEGHYGADQRPNYSVWAEPRGRVGLKLKLFDHTFDTGSGAGFVRANAELRARVLEAVRDYQQRHDAKAVLDFVAPMLGLREGRRVAGDYVLTVDDCRAGRRFEDSVACGTFTVDAMDADAVLPPYQIPYRSLLAAGVENLLVAGRCFSADRLALSSARIMPTGCLMGQAVGIAAALAAKRETAIRQVPPADIRDELLSNAVHRDELAHRILP